LINRRCLLPLFHVSCSHTPDPTSASASTQGAINLAKRHYIVSSLWIAGLIVLAFFKGAVVPPDRLDKYDAVMRGIDHKQ
jgi:hypothetical protein